MKILGMKSGKLAVRLLIVFAAAAVLAGIALLIGGLPRELWEYDGRSGGDYGSSGGIRIDENRTFSSDGIQRIEIGMSFEDIVVRTADGAGRPEITLRYYGSVLRAVTPEDVFSPRISGDTLVIDSPWKRIPAAGGRVMLEASLPADFSGSLVISGMSGAAAVNGTSPGTLEIRLMSGDIEADGIRAGEVIFKTASGDIRADSVIAEGARIESVSGDSGLGDIDVSGDLTLGSSSGRISGSRIAARAIHAEAVSGDMDLADLSGNLTAKSTSGNVDLALAGPGSFLDVQSASGEVDISLPPDTSFTLDARSVSGRIRSDYPVTSAGDFSERSISGYSGDGSGLKVSLKTVSGDISLHRR